MEGGRYPKESPSAWWVTLSQRLALGEQQVPCPRGEAVAQLCHVGGCIKHSTTLDQAASPVSAASAQDLTVNQLHSWQVVCSPLVWQHRTCLHPPKTFLSAQAGARFPFPAAGGDAESGSSCSQGISAFPKV